MWEVLLVAVTLRKHPHPTSSALQPFRLFQLIVLVLKPTTFFFFFWFLFALTALINLISCSSKNLLYTTTRTRTANKQNVRTNWWRHWSIKLLNTRTFSSGVTGEILDGILDFIWNLFACSFIWFFSDRRAKKHVCHCTTQTGRGIVFPR